MPPSKLDDIKRVSPAFARTASAKQPSQNRVEARESFMVKRSRPNPQLRPGPRLAAGADYEAFKAQWKAERSNAKAHQDNATKDSGALLHEARAIKDKLLEVKAEIKETLDDIQLKAGQASKDKRPQTKEAFIAERRLKAKTNHVVSLTNTFTAKAR